jgi:dephospho-CoA kinase
MKILGVTGGMGMGKSACAKLLQQRGVPVIDTDELAREVVEPGQPALAEIQALFGADLVGPDGRLRRDRLARRVFGDPAARRSLESILHPRIRELWLERAAALGQHGAPLVAVIIPLLFETGAEADLDRTLCVACSSATERERLAPRGWAPEEIQQRLAAQMPVEQKMARADYVIWSEGGLGLHAEQLDRILDKLLVRPPQRGPAPP